MWRNAAARRPRGCGVWPAGGRMSAPALISKETATPPVPCGGCSRSQQRERRPAAAGGCGSPSPARSMGPSFYSFVTGADLRVHRSRRYPLVATRAAPSRRRARTPSMVSGCARRGVGVRGSRARTCAIRDRRWRHGPSRHRRSARRALPAAVLAAAAQPRRRVAAATWRSPRTRAAHKPTRRRRCPAAAERPWPPIPPLRRWFPNLCGGETKRGAAARAARPPPERRPHVVATSASGTGGRPRASCTCGVPRRTVWDEGSTGGRPRRRPHVRAARAARKHDRRRGRARAAPPPAPGARRFSSGGGCASQHGGGRGAHGRRRRRAGDALPPASPAVCARDQRGRPAVVVVADGTKPWPRRSLLARKLLVSRRFLGTPTFTTHRLPPGCPRAAPIILTGKYRA